MEASARDEELEPILNPNTDLMSDYRRMKAFWKVKFDSGSLLGKIFDSTIVRLLFTFGLYAMSALLIIFTIIMGSIDTSRWSFWFVCGFIAFLYLSASASSSVTLQHIAEFKKARAQELHSNENANANPE